MKTILIHVLKYIGLTVIGIILLFIACIPVMGQQHVIANKDNMHPELNKTSLVPAQISAISATKWNGYNEISWTALRESDTRKYIVEYSANGVDYQSAGEVLVNTSAIYTLKHHTTDIRPLLYRVKIETLGGRHIESIPLMLDGIAVSPVSLYPTVVTGNTVNINSAWPVERISVTSSSGTQVFAKDLNGQLHAIPIVIPSLGKGIYFMSFYGKGWMTTEKFIVG